MANMNNNNNINMQRSDPNGGNRINMQERANNRELFNSGSVSDPNNGNQNQSEPPIVSVRINIPGVGQVDGLVRKYPDGSIQVVSIPGSVTANAMYVQSNNPPSYSPVVSNITGLLSHHGQPIYPVERSMPPASAISHSRSLASNISCPPPNYISHPSQTNSISMVGSTNVSTPRASNATQNKANMNFSSMDSNIFYNNGINRSYAPNTYPEVPPLQRIDISRSKNICAPPSKPTYTRPINQSRPENVPNVSVISTQDNLYPPTNNDINISSSHEFTPNISDASLTQLAFSIFHSNFIGVFKTLNIQVNEVELYNNAVHQWNTLSSDQREAYLTRARMASLQNGSSSKEMSSWNAYPADLTNSRNETPAEESSSVNPQKIIRKCLRVGCQANIEYCHELGGYYCSEQCAVLHSKSVYLKAYPNLKKVLTSQ